MIRRPPRSTRPHTLFPYPTLFRAVVAIDTSGSDRGLLRPMLEQVARRYGVAPARYLADGGFTRNADLDWAFDPGNGGTRVYAPPVKTKHGTDPYAPRPRDRAGVADWRRQMGSEAGQEIGRAHV